MLAAALLLLLLCLLVPAAHAQWGPANDYGGKYKPGAAFVVHLTETFHRSGTTPRRDRQTEAHSIYSVELSWCSILGCLCPISLPSLTTRTYLEPMRCRMERLGGKAANGYVCPPTLESVTQRLLHM